jgi:transcription factor STE12
MSLQQDFSQLTGEDLDGGVKGMQGPNGVVRRARSATVMELGPYPQKSHSCPIPTCGRLFKRLEHLKRHKRTHDRPDGAEGNSNHSGEEEEEYSGEDNLGSLEEASPTSESSYIQASLNAVANSNAQSNGMRPAANMAPHAFNSLQTLSMPMTMSQPQGINAGAVM